MSVITFGKPHQSYQGKSRPVLWWLTPDLAHYVLDCAPTLHRLPLPLCITLCITLCLNPVPSLFAPM